MRDQLMNAGIAVVIGVLVAGCSSTPGIVDEGNVSPENRRLLQLAGDVEARGDYQTAAVLYARAAEGSGHASQALLRLGNAQLKVGDHASATVTFAKVLTTQPEQPDALLGLGTAQLKSGDTEVSARTLAKACPLANTSAACNRLGTALVLAGRLDEALAAFDRAKTLAPDDLDVMVNIALVRALSGQTDQAVTVMKSVAESPLAQARHRANLVMVLGIAGRIEEARSVNVPNMSPTQKRELLTRAKQARDATTPLAKARAIGLLNAA